MFQKADIYDKEFKVVNSENVSVYMKFILCFRSLVGEDFEAFMFLYAIQHIQDDMQLKLNEAFMEALLCTGNQDWSGLNSFRLIYLVKIK